MQINNSELLNNFLSPSDKINIAIFSDCYYPLIGGITSRVFNQAKELSKFANVVVITGQVKGYTDDANLPFLVLRCKGLRISDYQGHLATPNLDPKFKKLLLSLNIDIIHLHTYFAIAKLAHWLKRKKDIPLIQVTHQRLYPEYKTIVHSALIAKMLTKYSLKMINKADEIWTVSQNVIDFYRKSGLQRDIKIDPSGTERIYPQNAEEIIDKINKKYNLKEDDNVCLCVGRVEAKQKNLHFLLQACLLAQQKVDFTLIFAGKGKDLKMLEKEAGKLGVKNVIFTGGVDDETLTGLMLRADLHLFPSLNDNFGLTKVECAVMHTPTLGISGTAVVEGFTDNIDGFISQNGVSDYATRIVEILNDKTLLKNVSDNASVSQGKTWADLATITFENTKSVLDNYKKSALSN